MGHCLFRFIENIIPKTAKYFQIYKMFIYIFERHVKISNVGAKECKGTKDKGMKKSTKIVLSIFTIVILLVIAIYLGVSVYFNNHFFPGSMINGIDASSKTVEEVERLIATDVQDYTITITQKGDKAERIDGALMSFEYVSDGAVQALKDEQNSFFWIYAYFNPSTYTMTAQTTYDPELLKKAMLDLDCFNEKLVQKPEDAYIEETASGYEIIEAVEGNQLDEEKVFDLLKTAVDSGETQLDLVENDCYIKPAVTAEDEGLNAKIEVLNKYFNQVITYNIGNRQEILDYSTIRDWMTFDDVMNVSYNWNKVADWMTDLSSKYDTYGREMDFRTSLGETVTVVHETYGWKIDEATEVEALLEILKSKESAERDPVYLETAMAYNDGDGNDIGDTYVEIDYTNQRMWFYLNGKLLVDTPVVTGNVSKDWASPEGIYCIYNKEEQAILKGEDYKTPVDYWLPYSGGVGIHDAKWRGQFGGTIYQSSGSHGCVNTPWDKAKLIYENISIGVPVVCYSAPNNLGEGPVSVSQPAETRVINDEGEEVTGQDGQTDAPEEETPQEEAAAE